MKINYKKLIIIIVLTFLIGSFFSFFTGTSIYNEIERPILSPPGIVFPIVWSILYILMGISYYIVSENTSDNSSRKIYLYQLIVNSEWTLIFFGLQNFLLGWIWIILLIILVFLMIKNFYNVNKVAGLLQIPYLIWLFIALYLNFSIYLLN